MLNWVKMPVSLTWGGTLKDGLHRGDEVQALQFLIIVSGPLSAPLSRNCLHNHLLPSASSSCPQCVFLYFAPSYPPPNSAGPPPVHAHWRSRSVFSPCPPYRRVAIDYCIWIVWWIATRSPNILLSADVPLPLCVACCSCQPLFTALAVTFLCRVWIHIWDNFSPVFSGCWAHTNSHTWWQLRFYMVDDEIV